MELGREGEDDDEMIGLVVKRVFAEANNTPEQVGEYTVGLESRVDDLMSWRKLENTRLAWLRQNSSGDTSTLPAK